MEREEGEILMFPHFCQEEEDDDDGDDGDDDDDDDDVEEEVWTSFNF